MTPPTDIAAIARSLSKAQREALVDPRAHPLPSMGPNGYDSFILSFRHGRSAGALYKRGLATLAFAPQILTPLGVQTRQFIEDNGL